MFLCLAGKSLWATNPMIYWACAWCFFFGAAFGGVLVWWGNYFYHLERTYRIRQANKRGGA